jgi:hypothetical protein
MSRPVIPVLALAFLSWTGVAAAAAPIDDKPVAEADTPATADLEGKKRKKRRGSSAHADEDAAHGHGKKGHAKKGHKHGAKSKRHRHAKKGKGHTHGKKAKFQKDSGQVAQKPGAPSRSGPAIPSRGGGHVDGKPGQRQGHTVGMPGARRGHVEDGGDDSVGEDAARPGRHPRAGGPMAGVPSQPAAGADSPSGRDSARAGRPAPRGGAQDGAKDSSSREPVERDTSAKKGKGKKKVVKVRHAKYLPDRWVPGYHRQGAAGAAQYDPRNMLNGVFLYNPPKGRHSVTVVEKAADGSQTIERKAAKPTRAVDRSNSFSIGLRGGTYLGEGIKQASAGSVGSAGLGLAARYRLIEALGVEASWARHATDADAATQEVSNPLQVSAQVFAFPWTRVSPFVSAGYTWTTRSYTGKAGNLQTDRVRGPHGGLGLELAVGQSAALDLEARYIHYGDLSKVDLNNAGALQGTLGLNFYF